MGFLGRFIAGSIVVMVIISFSASFARAQGRVEANKDVLGPVDVKECEGIKVTQCEIAKNLVLVLKMGEDLTCEGCFIQLRALDIAPGEDWSYADPHKVITVEEIKEMLVEIHRAYNEGMVRLDGFEVAARINGFCRDIKGPASVPAPTEKEKKETEMTPTPESKDQGPAPAQAPEKQEGTPPSGTEGSGTQQEEGQ
jgi:hypothetical protein